MVKGTKAEVVIEVIKKISKNRRDLVKEITLDMANSMNKIAKTCFPKAIRTIDRFHVQKLALDAIQSIRIAHRWEALKQENEEYAKAKKDKESFTPLRFHNGDSPKQLLARSRYLLYKPQSKWTISQANRAVILFQEYPDLKEVYELAMGLRSIYDQQIIKGVAYTKLAYWFNQVEESGFDSFKTIKRTFERHYESILNFFDNRSTNASAESFNAKIKDFRRAFRGVKDIKFFLFRLQNIFA